MIRAVIDTNVLVAGLRSQRGTSFRLLHLLGDPRWRPCLSVPVALEYEDVLKREFMETCSGFRISWKSPSGCGRVLRDPDDDRILELAARAEATIVTFNTRDFVGLRLMASRWFSRSNSCSRLESRGDRQRRSHAGHLR